MDFFLDTAKIEEIEMPITAANAQKTVCAVDALILLMAAAKAKTKISGANITAHFSGDAKSAVIRPVGTSIVSWPRITA